MSELRVVLAGSREEQQLIAFRDALRSDPTAGYAGVKRALAVRFPNDCALYSLAKSAFIQDVLAREFPPR